MEKVISTSSIQVLNNTNYLGWSKQVIILFQQKGYRKFLDYHSYNDWFTECGIVEDQKQRYDRLRLDITSGEGDEIAKKLKYDQLDDKFHSDLGRWSALKQKNLESWDRDEEMARGLLLSVVNDNYKSKLKEKQNTAEMWEFLKEEGGGNELGTTLLLVRC